MISHCANPECHTPLHYLRGGRLYRFDVKSPVEPWPDVPSAVCAMRPTPEAIFFWLCKCCCSCFSLKFDRQQEVKLVSQAATMSRSSNAPVIIADEAA